MRYRTIVHYRPLCMYSEHPSLSAPLPETTLWRYMDFTKFLSLLDRKELHFARSDRLGDPFEGSISRMTHRLRRLVFRGTNPGQFQKRRGELTKATRQWFFVNCWHESDQESPALWNAYSRFTDGIAIKTNFAGLRDSFRCSDNIYIGRVNYVDYETDLIPEDEPILPYYHKRLEFHHEKEVRAVCNVSLKPGGDISDFFSRDFPVGEYREIDLAVLVSKVIVSPSAEDWFVELAQSVAAHFQLPAPVERSSLDAIPRW